MAPVLKEPIDERLRDLPIIAVDIPVIYEDEGQEEMGESNVHTMTSFVLHNCMEAHVDCQSRLRVFADMDLHYHPIDRGAYVSPDCMVVEPLQPLPWCISSLRVGEDCASPLLVAEILSKRSIQQQDQGLKVEIYAWLRIPEYILIDATGRFLPDRLLLNRLQPDGTWKDERDADGGVTSRLGCRLLIDVDGKLRVVHAATGVPYPRLDEVVAGQAAEVRLQDLEAENARLRRLLEDRQRPRGNGGSPA